MIPKLMKELIYEDELFKGYYSFDEDLQNHLKTTNGVRIKNLKDMDQSIFQ